MIVIQGFGTGTVLNGVHINANYDGANQDFPMLPIERTAASTRRIFPGIIRALIMFIFLWQVK